MNIIDTIRVSGTDYTLSATSSGGTEAVEVTQAEYDALVSGGTVDPTAFYIITDATPVDISNYWTSAQTNSAINAAVSGKQDTLSAGTGIDITNNVISATGGGGGGKAIEAGRGIDVASGTLAYTVSFNLPIIAGTGTNSIVENATNTSWQAKGNYSHAEGNGTKANGNYSHAEGYITTANTWYSHSEGERTHSKGSASHTEGSYTVAENNSEHASGQYNVSNKANTTFGNSGNTLFSVGNGTADNARHNAFEVRQNGDIYITLNGQDVKLQDKLGGSSITVDSELSSTSENPVQNKVIYNKIDEVEQVTARALNELNDKIGDINTILESI